MIALVTGCAGFIGARLSEVLVREGWTVVGIDNFDQTYDARVKHHRLSGLYRLGSDFQFRSIDITRKANLDQLFSMFGTEAPFDVVFNLAGRAGIRPSVRNPWVYFDVNAVGTLNLLEMCRAFSVGKFVLASSSSVYSDTGGAHLETENTDRQLSPYAVSKKTAEMIAYNYYALYGIDVSALRFFSVYGPAGRPDMVQFRFLQSVAEERPVTIYGDGRQRRDCTYVDDIVRGMIAAARPVGGFEVINLGAGHPISVIEILELIEEFVGKKAAVNWKPRHPAEVMETWADTAKAERMLHWSPTVQAREGLWNLVSWYMENRAWAKDIATDTAAEA